MSQSVRSSGGSSPALPAHDLLYLVFSNFDGAPVHGSLPVAGAFFYNETATYIGIIAVVLALVGILIGVRARRPAAIALALVGVVLLAVEWLGPVSTLANELPILDLANWLRALMPLALVVAALAGIGMDGLLRKEADALDRIALAGAFGLAALFVAALWLFGRTANNVATYFRTLVEHEHTTSFLWPVIAIVLGIVVSVLLWWRPRLSTAGLSILLGTEVLSLLAAGGVLISSSPDGYPATAAVQRLQRIVGDARVGTGTGGAGCPLGILPDANILFGIHQVNMNEPIMPKKYYSEWERQNHSVPGAAAYSQFCPVITSAAQARQLGVSYVLEPAGAPGPTGTTFVTTLVVPNANPGLPGGDLEQRRAVQGPCVRSGHAVGTCCWRVATALGRPPQSLLHQFWNAGCERSSAGGGNIELSCFRPSRLACDYRREAACSSGFFRSSTCVLIFRQGGMTSNSNTGPHSSALDWSLPRSPSLALAVRSWSHGA